MFSPTRFTFVFVLSAFLLMCQAVFGFQVPDHGGPQRSQPVGGAR